VENVLRSDLKDGERVESLLLLQRSTGWTWERLSDRMGLSVHRVHALAAIARHEPVKEAVNEDV
jgi:hypothetical protein